MAANRIEHHPFRTPLELRQWFAQHHDSETELWVQIYKKASGVTSITWNDCIVEAIAWGWIDSLKQSLDEASYRQRLTPRKPKSTWSKANCNHAERLMENGLMMPAGMAHVEAAKADGRWESAYAGSSDMVIPDDFLAALEAAPEARAFFDTLDRKNLYPIYHGLQTARKPETRKPVSVGCGP